MLIGFIGTPCSGKTTIAAKLFASLKEVGMKTELVVEHARQYIAEKRFKEGLKYSDPVSLTNDDQFDIYRKQILLEKTMVNSTSPETIVISDTTAVSAALYMDDTFEWDPNRRFFANLEGHYDLIFYCHSLNLKFLPEDSNRIHDLDAINKLENKSLALMNLCKEKGIDVFELYGSLTLEQRYLKASHAIMERHATLVQSL